MSRCETAPGSEVTKGQSMCARLVVKKSELLHLVGEEAQKIHYSILKTSVVLLLSWGWGGGTTKNVCLL